MKNIGLILFISLFLSCKNDTVVNITVPDEEENSIMILGKATKEGLLQDPFVTWYQPNYDNYKLNSSIIEQLKPGLKNVKAKLFIGTWCTDSQQEVPGIIKVLDSTKFNYKNFEIIALDRNKETPDSLQKGFDIIKIPTLILSKDGTELNRIVEIPMSLSFEEDILQIINGEPYKHAYFE
jgi:thiol-disulfide isomerase/thioredoxin